jgi:hypothetical protein
MRHDGSKACVNCAAASYACDDLCPEQTSQRQERGRSILGVVSRLRADGVPASALDPIERLGRQLTNG